MKQLLFISMAIAAVACDGSNTREVPAPGGNPQGTAQEAKGSAADARQRDQLITLVGCLQGPGMAGQATGTSGTRQRGTAAAAGAAADANGGAASAARFTLVDATPASADSGGVGANGAGGSGGALASGRSSYDLDGIPATAAADVNKQVRVTGRIDPNPATIGGGSAAAANEAASGTPSGSAHGGVSGAASSGTAHGAASGSGSTGASPGAASGSGSGGRSTGASEGAAPQGANRRLAVESIQVVSERCARQ
jgi:hypothetical protein